MKELFKFLFLFILLYSCDNESKKEKGTVVKDNYRPAYSTKQIAEEIELAFDNMEPVLIENIFSEWHNKVSANSLEFINQNETIKAVFEVFEVFYKPNDLSKIGNWACSEEINLKCKYVVIQNKITYSVVNSKNISEFDGSTAKQNLISNFRPPVNLQNALYLTDEYEESINSFPEKELNDNPDISLANFLSMKKNENIELVKNYIPVLRDYWGSNWQLVTYPFINRIVLNKSITKASVEFNVGYQSGLAQLEKKENRWFVKKSEITP